MIINNMPTILYLLAKLQSGQTKQDWRDTLDEIDQCLREGGDACLQPPLLDAETARYADSKTFSQIPAVISPASWLLAVDKVVGKRDVTDRLLEIIDDKKEFVAMSPIVWVFLAKMAARGDSYANDLLHQLLSTFMLVGANTIVKNWQPLIDDAREKENKSEQRIFHNLALTASMIRIALGSDENVERLTRNIDNGLSKHSATFFTAISFNVIRPFFLHHLSPSTRPPLVKNDYNLCRGIIQTLHDYADYTFHLPDKKGKANSSIGPSSTYFNNSNPWLKKAFGTGDMHGDGVQNGILMMWAAEKCGKSAPSSIANSIATIISNESKEFSDSYVTDLGRILLAVAAQMYPYAPNEAKKIIKTVWNAKKFNCHIKDWFWESGGGGNTDRKVAATEYSQRQSVIDTERGKRLLAEAAKITVSLGANTKWIRETKIDESRLRPWSSNQATIIALGIERVPDCIRSSSLKSLQSITTCLKTAILLTNHETIIGEGHISSEGIGNVMEGIIDFLKKQKNYGMESISGIVSTILSERSFYHFITKDYVSRVKLPEQQAKRIIKKSLDALYHPERYCPPNQSTDRKCFAIPLIAMKTIASIDHPLAAATVQELTTCLAKSNTPTSHTEDCNNLLNWISLAGQRSSYQELLLSSMETLCFQYPKTFGPLFKQYISVVFPYNSSSQNLIRFLHDFAEKHPEEFSNMDKKEIEMLTQICNTIYMRQEKFCIFLLNRGKDTIACIPNQ